MRQLFPINSTREFVYSGKVRSGKVIQHVNDNVFRMELNDGSFRCFDARKCQPALDVPSGWDSVTA